MEHDLVAIRWLSPTELLVTLSFMPNIDIPDIDTSLHRFNEVKITYRFESVQEPN